MTAYRHLYGHLFEGDRKGSPGRRRPPGSPENRPAPKRRIGEAEEEAGVKPENPLFIRRQDSKAVGPVLSHDAVETVVKAIVKNVGINRDNIVTVRTFDELAPEIREQATIEGATEEIKAAFF